MVEQSLAVALACVANARRLARVKVYILLVGSRTERGLDYDQILDQKSVVDSAKKVSRRTNVEIFRVGRRTGELM